MTAGITGYGSYIPRLRLSRQAVAQANAWYAPQFAGRKGMRSMANWDEDSITMAVAAARDCLGASDDRSHIRSLQLVSSTLPFAERLNAGVVCEALTLGESVEALDMGGSSSAALSAVMGAMDRVTARGGDALVIATDRRKTRAASSQELDYGDGAAALSIGNGKVIAEYLGGTTLTVDFVDHFRMAGVEIDYHWEERWVRDEGIGKLGPRAIASALQKASVEAGAVDHFIFPTTFAKMDAQLAKACGIRPEAIADSLAATVGETGTPHALLMLAAVLERAKPGQHILLAQFGGGAQAIVLRVTPAIESFRPARGVSGWLARGVEEKN